jgi:kinesin family protein C2/C3
MAELTKRMEAARMENISLKLKIQSMRDRIAKSSVGKVHLENLRQQVANLRREARDSAAELNSNLAHMHPLFDMALAQSKRLQENQAALLRDITAKYLKEQTMRKLLYNKVQELRGNIRVFCRVRKDPRGRSIFAFPADNELVVEKAMGGTMGMEFEQCYGPDSRQEQVFEDTKPIILSCVDGYNVCIIAYGQTGSGKTYTMMGPENNPGVNRRAIKELLKLCNEREEIDYTITASMMEVYNEQIYDLLEGDRSKTLSVRMSAGRTYVDGAQEVVVRTQEEVEEVMQRGD